MQCKATETKENCSYGEDKIVCSYGEDKTSIATQHLKLYTFITLINKSKKGKFLKIIALLKQKIKATTGRSAAAQNQIDTIEDWHDKHHTCI